MRYRFIDAEKALNPHRMLCNGREVARSGSYAWRGRRPRARAKANDRLLEKIRTVHKASRGTYGSPRVFQELRTPEYPVSENRIARVMRVSGIRSKHRRKFRVTTQSNHRRPVAPNVLAREFTVAAPNRVWVGDITYVWTAEGWLYLAIVIDLFSRIVVGWSMSTRITDELTLSALRMAFRKRRPAAGLLFHSDRGSQYTSNDYRQFMINHQITASMSRRGNCWDNAVSESFFATLEKDLLHGWVPETRSIARTEIFDYIEAFYNRRRIHSTLGFVSPIAYEAQAMVL